MIHLKKISVFIVVVIFYFPSFSQNKQYSSENFSFTTDSGRLVLHGTLTIPNNFKPDGKLMIMVAPPSPISRDYYGIFKSLADTLSKNGIAVLGLTTGLSLINNWAMMAPICMTRQMMYMLHLLHLKMINDFQSLE